MGFKEVYAKRIEVDLERLGFELENLKKEVDEKGLGAMPEWLNALLDMRDRLDEARFHINYLRRKRNPRTIEIAKRHIVALMDELTDELSATTKRFRAQMVKR